MVSRGQCPTSINSSSLPSYWKETRDWITTLCLTKYCQTRKLHWSWSAGFRGSPIRARYWSYLRKLRGLSAPQWCTFKRQVQDIQCLDHDRLRLNSSKEMPLVVEFSTQARKTTSSTVPNSRETFSKRSLKHRTRSYSPNSLPVMGIQGSRSALYSLTWFQTSHLITTSWPRHQWTQRKKSVNTTMTSYNGSSSSKGLTPKNKLNRLHNWHWSMWAKPT